MKLSNRIREFRTRKGLSQQDLANLLGVGKITVLRWETNTSLPSPLAAEKLESIGFGKLHRDETKQASIPRLLLKSQEPENLRDGVRKRILIGKKAYDFEPSPYVVNGPENQLPFFEVLYELQELPKPPGTKSDYAKRLSVVTSVPSLNSTTTQFALEHPKPTAKHWNPNYGPHGWHRYIGRFPPHLVRAILNHFGARNGDVVCDPFAGSGTTLVESRLLGLRAIGIEICPLSCLISRVKSKFPSSTLSLEKALDLLTPFYQNRWTKFVGRRNVATILHEEIIQRKGNSIPTFPNYKMWLTPEALLGSSIVIEFANRLDEIERDAVCCALSSCMRSVGNVDVDVVRAEYSRNPRKDVQVLRLVQRALHKMISDINQTLLTHRDSISDSSNIQVIEGSLLDADIPPSSIDFIITSPPYGVESISYLRTHLLSYRCLQPVLNYDPYSFNQNIIGSEYVQENGNSNPNWGAASFSKTFVTFFKHELNGELANKILYRKNMMTHFFDDMVKVAQQFRKWLRLKGRLAFVVGNKKIADHVMPTDAIVSEIFASFGLHPDSIIRHKLKCNNSNSEVPWQERTIQDEFVMIFTRR